MFDYKQLNTLVKVLEDAIDNKQKHLNLYGGYLSSEEKKVCKMNIEEYENLKMNIELEIGNRDIVEQMG